MSTMTLVGKVKLDKEGKRVREFHEEPEARFDPNALTTDLYGNKTPILSCQENMLGYSSEDSKYSPK